MGYGINTRCIYGEEREQGDERHYGALSYPIYQTATFQHPQVGVSSGYDYSRLSNPTRNQLESVVASLEKGTHAYAFSSGMAAITVAMEIFSQGSHIIAGDDLYGGSVRLFDNISKKNGYEVEYVDTSREDVEKYIRPETKAVYIETPTNPMMNVTDIAKVAEITKNMAYFSLWTIHFCHRIFRTRLNLVRILWFTAELSSCVVTMIPFQASLL